MIPNNEHGIDLPFIPDDLLSTLNIKYPERCPDINDSERQVWFKAGQRSVIHMLNDQKRRQQEADAATGLNGIYLEGGA